jgi:hypothetical protein
VYYEASKTCTANALADVQLAVDAAEARFAEAVLITSTGNIASDSTDGEVEQRDTKEEAHYLEAVLVGEVAYDTPTTSTVAHSTSAASTIPSVDDTAPAVTAIIEGETQESISVGEPVAEVFDARFSLSDDGWLDLCH